MRELAQSIAGFFIIGLWVSTVSLTGCAVLLSTIDGGIQW